MSDTHREKQSERMAFIGGGNMASAIIGGLIKRGAPATSLQVIEPFEEQRSKLKAQFGVQAFESLIDCVGQARVGVRAK